MRLLLLFAFTALLPFVSCHKSGGGGGPAGAGPAQVPPGYKSIKIDMAGDWEITEFVLASTNLPKSQQTPPEMGLELVFASTGLLSLGGDPVNRASLIATLQIIYPGKDLVWYLNQANGRTVLYGYKIQDEYGSYVAFGLAGIATNKDTIMATWAVDGRESNSGLYLYEKYTIVLSRTGRDSSNLRFLGKESKPFKWINR